MAQTKADLLKDLTRLRQRLAHMESKERLHGSAALGMSHLEGWLQQAMDHANDAMFYLDLEGKIIWANRKAGELVNGFEADLVSQSFFSWLTPESAALAQARLAAVKQGEVVKPVVEFQLCNTKGCSLSLDANVTNVHEEGRLVGRIVIGRHISDRKSAKVEQGHTINRMIRQQAVLLELAKTPFVDLQTSFHQVTETTARTLDIERVSVWLFNEDQTEIRCCDLFTFTTGAHEEGGVLSVKQYPRYFEALRESRCISAHDAHTDPRTSELAEEYLDACGITSIMDAPIRLAEKTIGVLCHEHTSCPREWTMDEQSFAGSMADLVALAIETAEVQQTKAGLQSLNQELEHRVEERMINLEAVNKGLVKDISVRRQIEEALAQEKDFTSHIVEATSTLIVGISPDGICTYLNQAVTTVTGYQQDEVLGRNYWELFYPGEEQRQVDRLFEDCEKQGFKVINYDMDMTIKDGSKRTISWNSVNRFDPQGTVVEIVGIGVDVTERKKMEDALKQSEARYQDLFDRAPDMYVSVEAKTGMVRECNQTICEVLGLTKEKILGHSVFPLYHPHAREKAQQVFQTFKKTGVIRDAELQLLRKDGSAMDVLLNVSAVRDTNGNILHSRSVWRDISERKRLERAKDQLQLAIDQSMEGMALHDDGGRIEYVNPAQAHMYGYEIPELLGKSWHVLYGEDEVARIEHEILPLLHQQGKWRGELVGKRKTGEAFDVEVTLALLKDRQGDSTGLICSCRDITERKQAEQKLQIQAKVLEHMVEGVSLCDEAGTILYTNAGEDAMFGYDPGELLGKHVTTLNTYTPEINQQIVNDVMAWLQQHEVWKGEFSNRRKDSSPFVTSANITALVLQGKKHYLCVQQDISEQKQAEEILRKSEEEMCDLLAGTAAVAGQEFFPILVKHLAQALHVKYALITELLDDEFHQTQCLAIWMGDHWGPPFIYSLASTPCEEAIRTGEALYPKNLQGLFPNDQDLIDLGAVSYKGIRLANSEGKAIGHLAIMDNQPFVDSPRTQALFQLFAGRGSAELERKRAEESLRDSEERFRTLVTLSKDPIFYVGTDQEILYVNPAVKDVLGYSPEEVTKELIPQVLHPSSIASFERFWKFYEEHQRFSEEPLEMTWIRKTGGILHGHQHFTNVVNDQGHITGFFTILRDITERKKMEDTLLTIAQGISSETGNQFYRSLAKHLSEAFGVGTAFIGKFVDPECQQVQVLAMWGAGQFWDTFKYPVQGRACENAGQKPFWCFPKEVRQRFPHDQFMIDLGVESYAGARIISSAGVSLGLIGILHGQELTSLSFVESILKIFASRVAAEMERCAAENRVQTAYIQLRELTRRLGVAEEWERQRIARELHDEFGQMLTALKFDMSWLSKRLRNEGLVGQEDVQKKLASMGEVVDETVNSVRRIATSLRPSLLDDLGLVAALDWVTKDFQSRTEIECEFVVSVSVAQLAIREETSIAIYRITQELLTNILRHAQASKVHITLREDAGCLELTVADNGIGYQESVSHETSSWGIVGMRERASLLGGEFLIQGEPGQGTRAMAKIPLNEPLRTTEPP